MIPSTASRRHARLVWRSLAGLTVFALLSGAPLVYAGRPATATPKPSYGGTIAVRDYPPYENCIDVARYTAGNEFTHEVLDTLVVGDTRGHIYPDLATKWSTSHGGTWITFTLRRGVRFSNGDAFNASAVKYSFDRVLDPKFPQATAGLLGPIQTVQVVNPFTVRLIFKAPFRPILNKLTGTWIGIVDPKATAKRDPCTMVVGTGPYKIQSVGPALSSFTLVRNPYHTWEPPIPGNTGRAYIDKIVYKPIANDATAVSALLSHEVNVTNVAGDQLSRVQGNSNYVIHKTIDPTVTYFQFNLAHAPFTSLQVRRAFIEAVDRTAVVKVAVNGQGVPAYGPVPQHVAYYDRKAPTYLPKYNPADAQRIFTANHVTGPYTLLVPTLGSWPAIAELMQAELGQVGVRINIVTKDIGSYFSDATKGNFDLTIYGYTATDPDMVSYAFLSGQPYNISFFKSKTLDGCILRGRDTFNAKVASAAYSCVQKYLDQNAIFDPLFQPYDLWATDKSIGGYRMFTAGYQYPYFRDLYISR
ncbi:MAG: hypothetical protein JOZ41_09870 [Chloroflexi bacterium]|nr:hypothetical protein [Chloroflexota bacterium]